MSSALVLLFAVTALPPDQVVLSVTQAHGLADALFVDTRSHEAFQAGHVPGATHLDPQTLSEKRGEVVGLLKPFAELKKILAAAGVDPARHIVVYSDTYEVSNFKDAARLFWILEYLSYPRVSVLDGGFAAWKDAGLPVESGEGQVKALDVATLEINPTPERYARSEDVIRTIAEQKAILLDLRSAEQFCGITKSDVVATASHIPSAINLPATDLVSTEKRGIQPMEIVSKLLADVVGGDHKRPIVTYCNTGREAAVGYLVLRAAGYENVALYDGSMAEWSHLPTATIK